MPRRTSNKTSFKPKHLRCPSPKREDSNNDIADSHVETRSQTSQLQENKDEYIIINISCLEGAWNSSNQQHRVNSPQCLGFLNMQKELQSCLSTSWSLRCDSCTFHSETYRMFKTVPTAARGRKPSSLNRALGVALVKSPIGATVFSEIFLTLGINPGSVQGLTDIINAGSEICTNLCDQNTAAERQKLKHVPDVAIEGDARYNNHINGNTPFQAGTQVTWTVCENVSPEKKIIHVVTENKLCTQGARLRTKGEHVSCPESHPGLCTATMKASESIGSEGRLASQSACVLKKEEIPLKIFTTDCDCEMANAFKEHFPNAEWLKDSVHFSRSQKKAIKAAKFSDTMFPGTKVNRQRNQRWFAEDVRQRCCAEMTAAINRSTHMKDGSLKIAKTNAFLLQTPQAIVDCYQGNCHSCRDSSLVCSGESSYAWPKHFQSSRSKNQLNMTDSDKVLLKRLICKRLGPEAVKQTYLNTNTQKTEAVHRAYSKTNPKNITSPRNFAGRIGAAVLNVNLGFAGSTCLVQSAVGHNVAGDIRKEIEKRSKYNADRKDIKKKLEIKKRRVIQRASKYRLYEKKQESVEAGTWGTYEREIAMN